MDLLLLHPEIVAAVGDQLIVFYKRTFVEEQFHTLASSQFVVGMLLVDSGLASSEQGLFLYLVEAFHEGLTLEARETAKTHGNEGCVLPGFESQCVPANRLHFFLR